MTKSLLILFAIISSSTAFAMECVVELDPVHINRCDSIRNHGGEVDSAKVEVNGKSYRVINAPQTFQSLYPINCTVGGKSIQMIGDIFWDCVGVQEIAGVAIESENPIVIINGVPPSQEIMDVLNAATDAFETVIQHDSPDEMKAPSDLMPAPMTGIRYWDTSAN